MKFDAGDILAETSAERELWAEAIDFAIGSAAHAPGCVLTLEEILARTYAIGMVMKYGELSFQKEPAKKAATRH